MKKLLSAILLMLFLPLYCFADVIPEKIYAVAHYNINKNTINKSAKISLYSYDDYEIKDIITIKEGQKIIIKLDEYVPPKRGKRDGYYKVTYIGPFREGINGNGYQLTGTMRVSTPKDIKEIAKKTGVTITGQILKFPGFSQAVAAAKGLILPNENQSRLKSAGENLYESTPLTYVEKGRDFSVESDGIVVIKLKNNGQ